MLKIRQLGDAFDDIMGDTPSDTYNQQVLDSRTQPTNESLTQEVERYARNWWSGIINFARTGGL